MAFQSIPFLAFLAVSITLYYFLPARWRAAWLACLSFAFYLTWSIPYTLLLFAVTAGIFYAAQKLESASSETNKARIARWGVLTLLLLLCVFKYAKDVTAVIPNLEFYFPYSYLLIPLGISYYVFKLISYVVDVYAGKLPAEHNFAAFTAYVAFFPQIVAGPIQRAADFLPQISMAQTPKPFQLIRGLKLMLFGFFKKLVIADALSLIVAPVYSQPGAYSGFELLIISYLFALQLYADFSGITDIAIGSAQLFGINSPKNFENPFYARTIQDFWRRWHITLTSWMRDYVFLPLRMKFRSWGWSGLMASILINMILIGVWHGVSTVFFWFGIIHGASMVLSVSTLKMRDRTFGAVTVIRTLRKIWQPVITFTFVSISLIFFRAPDMQTALTMLSSIFSFSLFQGTIDHLLATAFFAFDGRRLIFIGMAILMMETMHIITQSNSRWRAYAISQPAIVLSLCYTIILMIALSIDSYDVEPFIYFRF